MGGVLSSCLPEGQDPSLRDHPDEPAADPVPASKSPKPAVGEPANQPDKRENTIPTGLTKPPTLAASNNNNNNTNHTPTTSPKVTEQPKKAVVSPQKFESESDDGFEKFDDEKDPGAVVSSLASERDEDEDSIDALAIQKPEDVAVQVSSRSWVSFSEH